MKPNALEMLEVEARKLNPLFSGRVSWEEGDPICPEWVFPWPVDISKLLQLALKYHLPIGCWPVGPPDGVTGVRVVVGRSVRLR